ncbi:MAG: phosphoribosyltransferase [Dehalococcoidia bacterium]|nr:MAG: phosphoribosyltransferase [Dehalococcoidia bacterium]
MNNWRIVERTDTVFKDRVEAGELLARELGDYIEQHPIVLGIPRGGVVVAGVIVKKLGADLELVLARKLRVPGQPELAFGAIAENGYYSLNHDLIRMIGISEDSIKQEMTFQAAEIERRKQLFRKVKSKIPLTGRVVIITDDGVATGETFKTALNAVRQEQPEKIIAALPVGSENTIIDLARIADQVLCLRCPAVFRAVGQFYRYFDQIEDDETLAILV